MAWRLCRQRNPAIGEHVLLAVHTHAPVMRLLGAKLAYNYLKCRRLFDCIETCHCVLQLSPDHPKIKRDILDKARAFIRM